MMSEPEVFVVKPVGKESASNENYEMVNLLRRLDVSEHKPDPASSADSLDSGLSALTALAAGSLEMKPREPKSRESKSREAKSRAPAPQEPLNSVPSPKLAPEPGGSATVAKEVSKESTKSQTSKDAPKVEAVLSEVLRPAGKAVAATPPSRDDPCDNAYYDDYEASWAGEAVEAAADDQDADTQDHGVSDKRRLMVLAAVIGLAVVSGAVGGALVTARIGNHAAQSSGNDQIRTASVDNQAVEESIARIDTELSSLKQVNDDQSTELYDRLDKVEKALRAGPAASASTALPKETIARIDSELASLKQSNEEQSTKVNDRLDKFEKAQAEPAAKVAKLSQAIERQRAASAAAAAAAMPKETIARIDSELASLKQFNEAQSAKLNDRLDKVEKLAKLSQAVERQRAASAAFASTAMPPETSAPVQPQVPAQIASTATSRETSAPAQPPVLAPVASAAAPRETGAPTQPPVPTAVASAAAPREASAATQPPVPAPFASTVAPREASAPTQPPVPAPVASTAAPREASAPTQPSVPAPVVASIAPPRETTASIQPPAAALKPKPKLEPKPETKPEVARLPTVDGWVLRDITNDGAVIEGRQGLFEVLAGDAMPGLGRVEAIRRQDGRWVVVTTKGLIVAR
jgi:hypothetical protein